MRKRCAQPCRRTEPSAGPEAESLLGTYWSCGDVGWLTGRFEAAGFKGVSVATETCSARYASAEAAIATEVESTPLIDRISPATYAQIMDEGQALLRPYEADDGAVRLPVVGHLVRGEILRPTLAGSSGDVLVPSMDSCSRLALRLR